MSEASTFSVLRRFPSEAIRILKLSRKPSKAEYDEVMKITALGIIVLGAVGYAIIFLAWTLGNTL